MQHCKKRRILALGSGIFFFSTNLVNAQLTDETQTFPHVPGSAIAKSLEEQIGTGQGDALTPGSSIYLIKRDPARSIRRGRQLFQRKFTAAQGQGPRFSAEGTGDIQDNPALGAGLADACAVCHGRPRGSAGFGGDVATRPDSRDSPHLFGLGLVEQLADEMTQDLRAIRAQIIRDATGSQNMRSGEKRRGSLTRDLVSKGIHFGTVTASADGSLDTTGVEGVDEDFRVKPFFHHGGTVSMREFIIGAFKAEMGLEAWDPILCTVTDPDNPQPMTSPAGFRYDPAADDFERPPVCSPNEDGDGDGVHDEIDPALVDHMEFYLLNYFKPGRYKITSQAKRGLALMNQIGCTNCHVQNLSIDSDRRVADVETQYDKQRGIFNHLFATATTLFEPFDDGQTLPQLLPAGESFVVENFFSDLKRHDLGPAFHERNYDGSVVQEFVTEPLWGVGSTAPYGHDGRSINLDAVIRRHGGEARSARRGYMALRGNDQRKIQEFLQTLVLFPPDDTASDLNPGNPGTNDPQSPSEHGSINLGALFQIDEEGPE